MRDDVQQHLLTIHLKSNTWIFSLSLLNVTRHRCRQSSQRSRKPTQENVLSLHSFPQHAIKPKIWFQLSIIIGQAAPPYQGRRGHDLQSGLQAFSQLGARMIGVVVTRDGQSSATGGWGGALCNVPSKKLSMKHQFMSFHSEALLNMVCLKTKPNGQRHFFLFFF